MSNKIRVILSVIVEIAIIGLWLVILSPWDNTTAGPEKNPGESNVTSINNPPVSDITQYRMSYPNSGEKELIIDMIQQRAEFAITYLGNSNFELLWKRNDGEDIQIITDQVGPFQFVQPVEVPYTGPYLLKVITEGDWKIEYR